jgi:chemotaxis protein CheC
MNQAQNHIDLLKERLMDSFLAASASLSQLLNRKIGIEIVDVQFPAKSELRSSLLDLVHENIEIALVQQSFTGEFSGDAFLVYPYESLNSFLTIFQPESDELGASLHLESYYIEIFLELSNIIIGANLGEVANLFHVCFCYQPPYILLNNQWITDLPPGKFNKKGEQITISTKLILDTEKVPVYLLFILPNHTVSRLFNVLDKLE